MLALYQTLSLRYLRLRWGLNALVVVSIALGVSVWVATSALYQSLEESVLASLNPMAGAADLIVSNGRLLAVARRQSSGLELYSLRSGKAVYRATLQLASGPLEKIELTEVGRGAAVLEISWKGASARFRLPKGERFVETQGLSGDVPLRIDCPGRFVVLPDFFADDILVDARKLPLDRVDLPSENFVLHFTGKQDAIVMGVFENRDQDVRVTLAGKDQERSITGSEIAFGQKGRKIWVSRVPQADFIIVMARVGSGKRHEGITAFIVEKGTKGFEIAREIPMIGVRLFRDHRRIWGTD